MDKRSSHTGKSRSAREAYSRYIKRLDYEPTAKEALPFHDQPKAAKNLWNQHLPEEGK